MTHVHLATAAEAAEADGAAEAPGEPRVPGAAGTRAPGLERWTTEWCTRPESFALLAPEWRRLHRACPAATPFQSHAWLDSWWRSYGSGRGPRVLLVRRAGQLVAAAPLMRAPGPVPALVFLGGPISDFGDVLIDAAHAAPAARALAAALHRAARTAVLDLRELRPGAAAESLLAHWTGPLARRADSVCLELPALPMDEQLARLPRSTAQRVRAKLRKTDALGVESRAVPAEEVPAAVRTLLGLHRLQWQGRRVTPEHLRPRFRDHLVRAARAMVRSGEAAVTEYRLDGRVVAADLTLLSPSLAGGYLYGADPGLRSRKADVTSMLLRTCARYAAGEGRTTLSLLRGTEPYKEHWRPERVVNSRLLLARRRTAPLLWLRTAQAGARARAAHWARARAARAAKDGTPGRTAAPGAPAGRPGG